MGLLVTLFLSLTTLLVSTISSSPPVAVGISALSAWIIIQYVFIVAAILGYASILVYIRFTGGSEESKNYSTRSTDKIFITLFPLTYFLIIITYWSVCLTTFLSIVFPILILE